MWIWLFTFAFAFADAPADRCRKTSEPKAPRFNVVKTLAELASQFQQLYESDTRLAGRIYWHPEQHNFLAPYGGSDVVIPKTLIEKISDHLQIALERGYADYPFYSDLGHAHLLYPKTWGSQAGDSVAVLEKILNSNEAKVLYHTAELLQLREGKFFNGALNPDPYLQWRYYSRNILGDLENSKNLAVLFAKNEKYNTVRSLDAYREWGTFYFSANKNGCFPFQFQGKTHYFDLSFSL